MAPADSEEATRSSSVFGAIRQQLSTAASQSSSSAGAARAGEGRVTLDELPDPCELPTVGPSSLDELPVDPREHVAAASNTKHSPPLIPAPTLWPGRAEHDDGAARHVLAGVVAGALDDRGGAGVAHREPLAGPPGDEELAGRRAVEHGVADQHRVARRRRAGARMTMRPPPSPLPT
jgi:hypothetical protein